LRSAVESGAGRLFFATTAGLLATARSGASLRRIGLPLSSDSAAIEALQIDRAGRLWMAGENRLCDRRVPGGATPDPPAHDAGWTCRAKPAAAPTNALVEAPSGAIWLALGNRGVWRLTRTGWESIAGTRALATIGVANLVPSRAGGFWVLGADVVVRVIEDTAHTAGWRVVERLSGWHGLPHSSAADIHEQADGTLWIATMMGVVRVPASVRREAAPSPRVLLVDGSVDADAVALDRPIRLPSDRNRLRLRFAAITYRDPLLLRYQVRALPGDEWETVAGTAEFRWVDLDAGQYRAEVRASLDGEHWSAEPASFAFQVLPPWYRTRWALAAFAAVAAAIAVLVHRARVAVHVELERQRMRIAMDLHDELGSGLGSIGILAGVLQSSPPPGAPGHAHEIAADIGGTAAALGSALSDIVWALDRRSAGLDAIASRLAEHGDRVFPNGAARFATRFPRDWPDRRFDLGERRNLLLIGLEALHNAARHAHASRVELRIDAGGAGFTLEVRDDGVGLPADAEARGGLGLASMRSRARQIGAELRLLPGPAGGTIVCVRMNGRPSRSTSTRSERPGQRAGRHHRG
jgi:signal transduction histidine kinase